MNNDPIVQEPKRLPFSSKVLYAVSVLAILIAAALIVFATIGFIRDNQQQTAIDDQNRQTKELVEQVKALAEQNQKTTQQAANYAYCNAVLLSQYTRTLRAITIEDLNTCVLNSFPESTVTPPVSNQQNNTNNSSSSNSSSQGNTSTNTPAPVTPSPVPTTPTPTPTPNQNSPTIGTTPTGLLPGINVSLPCVNALGLLQIGCK